MEDPYNLIPCLIANIWFIYIIIKLGYIKKIIELKIDDIVYYCYRRNGRNYISIGRIEKIYQDRYETYRCTIEGHINIPGACIWR